MKKSNGFTLIELMITIVIAAILLTVAVPSFLDSIRRNRLTSQAGDIVTALNVARSEAIKLGTNVVVCSTTDQATCGGANDWSTGWLVMRQDNGELIKVWDTLNTGSTLTGDAATSDDATQIIYSSRGIANGAICLMLTATGATANEERTISVTPTGRVNIISGVLPVGHECI